MSRIPQEFDDVPFETLSEGQIARSTYHITPELVGRYNTLVGHPEPAGAIAPPWVYCSFLPLYHAIGGRMQQGSVHTHQAVEHIRPSYVGEVLDVEVTVLEKTDPGDERRRVVFDTRFDGPDGHVRCRVKTTLLWGHAA